MKLKYYMRGLGVGILFSVAVMLITGGSNQKMSDLQIKEAARKLGMVDAPSENSVSLGGLTPTPVPTEAVEETAEGAETTGGAEKADDTVTTVPTENSEPTATPSPTATPEPTATPSPTKAPEATVTPAPTKVPASSDASSGDYIILKVTAGMWSQDVAKEARRIGLIDDEYTFNKYMTDNGYASKIHVNDYKIKKGASIEEIAKIITTHP